MVVRGGTCVPVLRVESRRLIAAVRRGWRRWLLLIDIFPRYRLGVTLGHDGVGCGLMCHGWRQLDSSLEGGNFSLPHGLTCCGHGQISLSGCGVRFPLAFPLSDYLLLQELLAPFFSILSRRRWRGSQVKAGRLGNLLLRLLMLFPTCCCFSGLFNFQVGQHIFGLGFLQQPILP